MARPLKFTLEELEKKINDYFISKAEEKKDKDKKMIYMSFYDLASFLDIDHDTLNNYQNRLGYSEIVKRAKTKIINNWIPNLYFPGRNATGTIFYLKNAANMSDRQDINHNVKGIVEHNVNLEALPDDQLQQLTSVLEDLDDNNVIDVTPEEEKDQE